MPSNLTGNVYLVRDRNTNAVVTLLEKDGVHVQGNPDVYVRQYGQFGIDDAHDLTARTLGRAMNGMGRTFVICASGMTSEAQNALLKTIEEPAGNARFFFVLPAPETLLATVRSRAQMYHLEETDDVSETMKSAQAFLSATPVKRIEMLKPLLEKNDDEKRDLGTIITFLSSLEVALALHPHSEKKSGGLKSIYNARKYIGDKGALLKPLLESVALLVPKL